MDIACIPSVFFVTIRAPFLRYCEINSSSVVVLDKSTDTFFREKVHCLYLIRMWCRTVLGKA